MDRLKAMHSFVRVMHAGNFSTAARQLGVSRALISRHIIELERHLGFALLSRSTRNVVPTDQARPYLKFCERVFRELEREQDFVPHRDRNASTLKIVAPKSFGTLKLTDAVLDFAAAEPRFQVSLSLEDFSFRPNEFIEKGYDIAICISSISDSALISRRIAALDWVLCATPDYVRRHGRPHSPADLKNHPCLAHLNLEMNDSIWRFERDGDRASIKIGGPFRSNSGIALRKAALRSLGIAVLPRYAIASDLAAGSLIPLLRRYRLPQRPLSAIYPRSLAGLPKIKAFLPWLTRWFRNHDPNSDSGAAIGSAPAPTASEIVPIHRPNRPKPAGLPSPSNLV
jgi:DNA-binding transcriptional LysR family regulator